MGARCAPRSPLRPAAPLGELRDLLSVLRRDGPREYREHGTNSLYYEQLVLWRIELADLIGRTRELRDLQQAAVM